MMLITFLPLLKGEQKINEIDVNLKEVRPPINYQNSKPMKQFYLIISLLFFSTLSAQVNNANYSVSLDEYTKFNSTTDSVYLIETQYCVVQISLDEISATQVSDSITMIKILNRVDNYYEKYKSILGYEPLGGNSNYGMKANVYFGKFPSCGSGCGLLGSKGIEISGFENIWFNLKHDLNVSRDVIIGYEFGRNFYPSDFDKISLPVVTGTNQKNGGFAEGFANLMYTQILDSLLTSSSQRDLNETFVYKRTFSQIFHAYVNDLDATPYNSLAYWNKIGVQDPSRGHGFNGPSYNGTALLEGLLNTFKISLSDFITSLGNLSSPSSVDEALSNIALATCYASGYNLTPFFENVLKFNLTSSAKTILASYPRPTSKLISDESELYFISPSDSIPLNIRSNTYLEDTATYTITIDNDTLSHNFLGNYSIPYSVLLNRDSATITVFLSKYPNMNQDTSYYTIKKRHNINLIENKDFLYSYYLDNRFQRNVILNDTILWSTALEEDSLDTSLNWFNLIFSRDREYELIADIKHHSAPYSGQVVSGLMTSGYSSIGFRSPMGSYGSSRVGYDIGSNNDTNFYSVVANVTSNNLIPNDGRKYVENQLRTATNGYQVLAQFKNIIFRDVTDTDSDGVIDFEDNCPFVYNPNQDDIDNNGIGDICDQSFSIDESHETFVKLWPNPSSNGWNISSDKTLTEIKVISINGQEVYLSKPNLAEFYVENSQIPEGVYIIVVNENIYLRAVK